MNDTLYFKFTKGTNIALLKSYFEFLRKSLVDNQLRYEATNSGFIPVSGFIPQLVRASHRFRKVTGSNPVEVLTFPGFYTQLLKLRS